MTGVPVRCMNRSERLVGLLAARRPEPSMPVARSVADVLDDHVVFEAGKLVERPDEQPQPEAA